jgi:NAD(P)-dependent dehydrogenase (short-subunit alcohol dehydrogenase family)
MKTALITGATDGIGKATAKKFIQANWNVVILGRNPKKVEATIVELQTQTGKNTISGITADLALMSNVKKAVETFLQKNTRLDVLLLNANAIANERIITQEGNEQNFAIGYLSRVLMIQLLQDILNKTDNSQVLSVMGRSWNKIDFDDLTIVNKFTGWKGLTRWQWAFALFMKNYARTQRTKSNIYSPGLVKTKILANEPQPMRALVKIMNIIMGISTYKAAENIYHVVNDIDRLAITGHFFEWKKDKGVINIESQNEDIKKLLELTGNLLNS